MEALPVVHLLCERPVDTHEDPTVTSAATSPPLARCSLSLSDEVTAVGPFQMRSPLSDPGSRALGQESPSEASWCARPGVGRTFQFRREKATRTPRFLCTWLPPPVRRGSWEASDKADTIHEPVGTPETGSGEATAGAVTSSLGHPVLAPEKRGVHRPGEAETRRRQKLFDCLANS